LKALIWNISDEDKDKEYSEEKIRETFQWTINMDENLKKFKNNSRIIM
jgi:hypothetical protein